MGNLELAVESLHRSLAIKRDDIVTSALLKNCIEDLMEENAMPDNISDVQDDTIGMVQSPSDKPNDTFDGSETNYDSKESPIFNASEKLYDVSMEM